jgi:hypothetical protein
MSSYIGQSKRVHIVRTNRGGGQLIDSCSVPMDACSVPMADRVLRNRIIGPGAGP